MKGLITHPEAQAELEAAADWYEQQEEGLGTEFLTAIEKALEAIQRSPKVFSPFKNTSIRKHVLRRFPYVIFYQELRENLWILAFAHGKRKPGYWLRRTTENEPPDG
jgi:toxin ParE1/3/4